MSRVPEVVSRDDYLKAVRPLLDLVGVTAEETYCDVFIGEDRITLYVVAREEGDDSEHPNGIRLADPPQEFAELGHRLTVRILD